ncbi:hypothetical protein ACA910_022163 [Epithemia clementina (nom. ined.)]
MDCDEVYNYWEPLHFVIYNNDGAEDYGHSAGNSSRGLQTWEYANEYALRTYAYIYPTKFVSQWILKFLLSSKVFVPPSRWLWFLWDVDMNDSTVFSSEMGQSLDQHKLGNFFLLRSFLGAAMACCELVWLFSLSQRMSVRISFWTGVLMLTGAGMNHAAAAYLPSSTWIMAWMLCSSCFLYQWNYLFCVFAVIATLVIGWPFGVVLLIPMGLFILIARQTSLKNLLQVLLWTALVTGLVQYVVMWIDEQEYGRWTLATLNIFTYNAAGGGDELYGVEPASYYVKNLLLNWNIVAPLAVIVMPLLMMILLVAGRRQRDWWNLTVMVFAPLLLWLAITVPRPHKEERFLFPIYPILCLGAVWALDTLIEGIALVLSRPQSPRIRIFLHSMVWVVAACLSLSRTIALSKYYSAPISIYSKLAAVTSERGAGDEPLLVCTCGEWYRFPSSFFLPKNTHLGFLRSSFTGQLPQQFSKFGSRPESRAVLQPFNDQNLEQTERYVNFEDCDWVIDLEDSECVSNDETSKIIARVPFLDAAATSALHRILYIPFLHEGAVLSGQVQYNNYVLVKL